MSESNQHETAADPMAAFCTRERANTGITFPLVTPEGQPTDHWLLLRGVDSDEYLVADLEAKREGVRIAGIDDTRKRAEAVNDLTIRLTAVLVAGWSFPKPCTPENVRAFLREAPQIVTAIDRVTGNRRLFFAVASSSSPSTPDTSSSST